jgi:hypothetical protein
MTTAEADILDDTLRTQLGDRRVAFRLAYQPSLLKPLRALLPRDYHFPFRFTPENVLPIVRGREFIQAISRLEAALNQYSFAATLMEEMELKPDDGRDLESFLSALTRSRACGLRGPDRLTPDPVFSHAPHPRLPGPG